MRLRDDKNSIQTILDRIMGILKMELKYLFDKLDDNPDSNYIVMSYEDFEKYKDFQYKFIFSDKSFVFLKKIPDVHVFSGAGHVIVNGKYIECDNLKDM